MTQLTQTKQTLPVRSVAATGDQAGRALADDRARLARLCARLTGDLDSAEDLAQPPLLVAHGQEWWLRQPDRWWPWLAGIARHLSVDWVRRHGRERARRDPASPDARAESAGARTVPARQRHERL
ncbi:MAG: hypothetical protein HY332_10795 [Chloroflexi bacterium]|nr:hypothetical protein [Chloroflexota bacterium]